MKIMLKKGLDAIRTSLKNNPTASRRPNHSIMNASNLFRGLLAAVVVGLAPGCEPEIENEDCSCYYIAPDNSDTYCLTAQGGFGAIGKTNDLEANSEDFGVCPDDDGDGFPYEYQDCDDSDPAIHPDATEICDDKDNNCDGNTDEGLDCGDDDDDNDTADDDDDDVVGDDDDDDTADDDDDDTADDDDNDTADDDDDTADDDDDTADDDDDTADDDDTTPAGDMCTITLEEVNSDIIWVSNPDDPTTIPNLAEPTLEDTSVTFDIPVGERALVMFQSPPGATPLSFSTIASSSCDHSIHHKYALQSSQIAPMSTTNFDPAVTAQITTEFETQYSSYYDLLAENIATGVFQSVTANIPFPHNGELIIIDTTPPSQICTVELSDTGNADGTLQWAAINPGNLNQFSTTPNLSATNGTIILPVFGGSQDYLVAFQSPNGVTPLSTQLTTDCQNVTINWKDTVDTAEAASYSVVGYDSATVISTYGQFMSGTNHTQLTSTVPNYTVTATSPLPYNLETLIVTVQ